MYQLCVWPELSQLVITPVSIIPYLLQFPQIIKGLLISLSHYLKKNNEMLQTEDKKLVILTRQSHRVKR